MMKKTDSTPIIILALVLSSLSLLLLSVLCCIVIRTKCCPCSRGQRQNVHQQNAEATIDKELEEQIVELLSLFPEQAFVQSHVEFGQDSCVICQEEFEAGLAVRIVPDCLHAFHSACLQQWWMKQRRHEKRCPICQTIVTGQHSPKNEEEKNTKEAQADEREEQKEINGISLERAQMFESFQEWARGEGLDAPAVVANDSVLVTIGLEHVGGDQTFQPQKLSKKNKPRITRRKEEKKRLRAERVELAGLDSSMSIMDNSSIALNTAGIQERPSLINIDEEEEEKI